jgi:hypothetical protein
MGLKFRRGTTAQKSGSLAFGEPYVNTDLGTLQIGGAAGDITLGASGTGSAATFAGISGSSLDITGNAKIDGNLRLGGNITIGDATADTVNVVASLSSSLIPSTTDIFDLGSPTKQWRDLYLSSASLYIDGTQVLSSNATELIFTTDTGQSIKFNELGSDNIVLQTVDGDIELKSSGGGDVLLDPTAGLISVKGNVSMQDGTAKFLSSGGTNIVFGNNLEVTGSIITTGTINGVTLSAGIVSSSAQTIANLPTGVVSGSAQTIANLPTGVVSGSSQLENANITNLTITNLTTVNQTASVVFSSGSNRFGDAGNDTHSFTGSVQVSGSLTTIGTSTATSFNGTINSTNGVVSGSSQITYASISSIPAGIVSGSSQVTGIGNAQLTNSSITIAGQSTALGSSVSAETIRTAIGTVVSGSSQITGLSNAQLTNSTISGISLGSNLATLTIGTGLSGTSYNGSGAVTIANTGVTSNVAGTGVTVSGGTGAVTISIGQAVATSSNVQFNSLGVGMAASATAGRIDAANDVVAFSSSDIRFKENITPIENALDKISKISGNTYDWKAENKAEHGYEGNDVGVIAQEIEAVLPQLVQTRENGFKAVKYDKLVALLIEGIKEQQTQIHSLTIEIEKLKEAKGL